MGNPNPENQFKPGTSGNLNGRPRKEDSITNLIKEYGKLDGEEKKSHKEMMVEKAYELAKKGDITAIKFITSYHDGMPKQSIEHSGHIANDEKDLSNLTEDELNQVKEAKEIIDNKGIDINGDNTDVA